MVSRRQRILRRNRGCSKALEWSEKDYFCVHKHDFSDTFHKKVHSTPPPHPIGHMVSLILHGLFHCKFLVYGPVYPSNFRIFFQYQPLCGSFRRAASFVELFIFLSDKIILNQGVIEGIKRSGGVILIIRLLFTD